VFNIWCYFNIIKLLNTYNIILNIDLIDTFFNNITFDEIIEVNPLEHMTEECKEIYTKCNGDGFRIHDKKTFLKLLKLFSNSVPLQQPLLVQQQPLLVQQQPLLLQQQPPPVQQQPLLVQLSTAPHLSLEDFKQIESVQIQQAPIKLGTHQKYLKYKMKYLSLKHSLLTNNF
jgi:hypothetical protein